MSDSTRGFSPGTALASKWALLLLAAAWTLLNCVKPVHVDDASYLHFAREFAAHPLDPYAFQMSWDQWPEPAIWSSASPVMSYWLASGARRFYNDPPILKLWMFPFAWLFLLALHALAKRFVGSYEVLICAMTAFSAAFLPSLNLMLDVPMLAIALLSIEAFYRARERSNWKLAILSGVLAAIAIETKYNAITVLPVIAITSILYRSWRTGAIAIAVCLLLTISWETSVALRYGQCQFVAQLLINDPRRRIALMQVAGELPAYFAGVCPFLMILAVRAITRQAAILSLVAMILVAMTLLARPILFDAMTGALIVLSCIAVARWWREHTDLADRKMMLALLAWVAVEAAMGLALSPFPAVRRLFALMIPTTLLLARCAFQRRADTAGVSQSDWRFACAICLLLAMFYYAVDLEDAWVRKRSVEGAVATAKQSDPNAHVWVIGHWGAEYYGERAGASLLVPDQSILKRGDFIVAADGVHTQMVRLPRQTLEVVARPLTRFCVPWTASPAFYAGIAPLERRVPIDATTPSGLQPTILRVTQDCILPCDFTLAYLSELANRRRSMAPDGLIRALIGYCANGADREVKTAQDALVSIGPRAMLIALRNESPRVRYFAAGELARYAQVAEVSQALQRAAHDPDAAVREQAQRALNGQIH